MVVLERPAMGCVQGAVQTLDRREFVRGKRRLPGVQGEPAILLDQAPPVGGQRHLLRRIRAEGEADVRHPLGRP
jgi:hypothetical protein